MPNRPILRLCLEPDLLKSAAAGQHNFINLIVGVVKNARFRVEFCPLSEVELFKHATENIYSLSHMRHPPSGRGLIFRRAYYYPFWQIDQTSERWHWDVAQASFDPAVVPQNEATRFAGFWKKRLFGQATNHAKSDGYVYVPLQGRLSAHRSFQICSPFEMLDHVLAHRGARKVVATLHPNETYSDADLAALECLEKQHPALAVSEGEMVHHLQHCDYVVTQNSSAAFSGYFFGKPALFFAGIDFHHIGVRADMANLADSFETVAQQQPDFDRYLWWYWQSQSINAGKDTAAAKIAARLQGFGWPI